jgi:hypothetical protein
LRALICELLRRRLRELLRRLSLSGRLESLRLASRAVSARLAAEARSLAAKAASPAFASGDRKRRTKEPLGLALLASRSSASTSTPREVSIMCIFAESRGNYERCWTPHTMSRLGPPHTMSGAGPHTASLKYFVSRLASGAGPPTHCPRCFNAPASPAAFRWFGRLQLVRPPPIHPLLGCFNAPANPAAGARTPYRGFGGAYFTYWLL